MTPSRQSASSLNNSETERRSSSHSLTRSPMVLKPSHWSNEMKEVTLVTARDGLFNFRMVGGSDHGEFPVISEVMPPDTRGVEYKGEAELTTQVGGRGIILNGKCFLGRAVSIVSIMINPLNTS